MRTAEIQRDTKETQVFVAVNLERAVYPTALLPRLQTEGYKIDVDYLNADQRPEAFFADLTATLESRRRVYLRLLREEAWDLFIGVITECDRLHHSKHPRLG